MIINEQKKDVCVSGDFNTTDFKIQANSKAFEILSSNIYTHKVRAVIREISCNAKDAQVGLLTQNKKFDVHLPTHLELWFSVRDYGIGLSDEDVRQIFTTYFCSTKTASNDFVGALGLGSKSPFCLVDSFTVVSFYNNVKRTYSCYKNEDGEPQVALLSTEEDVEEHNGIEVSMAVSSDLVEEFEEEAANVYKYFDDVPNINIDSVVKEIFDAKEEYTIHGEDFAFGASYGHTKALMGGVAYDIPDEIDQFNCEGYIKFDMGQISFDAGRESLSLDKKTKDAIATKSKKIKSRLYDLAIEQIEQEPTAFKKLLKSRKIINSRVVSDGQKIRNKYQSPVCEDIEVFSRSWRSTDHSFVETLPIPSSGNQVRYFRHKPRFKNRIKEYISGLRDIRIVLLTDEQIKKVNIDKEFIEDLDVIPKSERTVNRASQKVKVFLYQRGRGYMDRQKWTETTVTNNSEEKVYVEISRFSPVKSGFYWTNKKLDDAHSFTGLNQLYGLKSAFLKTKEFKNGNWIELADYNKRYVQEKYKDVKVYDDELRNTDVIDFCVEHALRLDVSLHDRIQKIISVRKHVEDGKHASIVTICERYGVTIDKCDPLTEIHESIITDVPMLSVCRMGYQDEESIQLIINHINETLKKGVDK